MALPVSLLLAACASQPDRPPHRGKPQMNTDMPTGYVARPISVLLVSMDDDHDKVITASELAAGIQREWQELTASGGDDVSPLRLGDWSEQTLGKRDSLPTHVAMDRDLNGQVTRSEFADQMKREFALLDKNRDGQLTRGELIFALPERQYNQDMGGGRPPQGRGGDRPPPR